MLGAAMFTPMASVRTTVLGGVKLATVVTKRPPLYTICILPKTVNPAVLATVNVFVPLV